MHEDRCGEAFASPEGRYANYFRIGHNAFEFVIDFAQLYEDSPNPSVTTRIVMSPGHAIDLLRTLGSSVEEYERAFGRLECRALPEH